MIIIQKTMIKGNQRKRKLRVEGKIWESRKCMTLQGYRTLINEKTQRRALQV